MQRFTVLYTHCYTSLLSFVAQPAAVFYMWYRILHLTGSATYHL